MTFKNVPSSFYWPKRRWFIKIPLDNPKNPLLDCQKNVRLFGKVDSPCIANWVLRKSGEDSTEHVKFFLNNNFYMNDYLKSMSNEKDFISLTCKIVSLLKCHGFNLKKFISNSEEVLQNYHRAH